jgi:hypothetical protein
MDEKVDVTRLVQNAEAVVTAEAEQTLQKALERSIKAVREAEQILFHRREQYTNLIETIRKGEFDFIAAQFNDIRNGR